MNRKTNTFKKTSLLSATMAMSLLLAQSSYAGLTAKRAGSQGGSGESSNTTTTTKTPTKKVDDKNDQQNGNPTTTCKHDPDAAKSFPLSFFGAISRDGSLPVFEQRPGNIIIVKMPAMIDSCGKFKAVRNQNPETKHVTITMEHEDGKTYSEFIQCLADKKLLVEDKLEIDHDKIPGREYSEYSIPLDYAFDKDKDIKKSVKISFGYPKNFLDDKDLKPVYGLDSDVTLPGTLCMEAEKIQPEITYLNKGQDVMIEELKAICKTGDAQKIAEARKSIGNADALKDIVEKIRSELDAGYLAAVKADVERISKDMTKIEDRMTRERNSLDEGTAKKLARQYADLAKELDNKFLNPAITQLDNLLKQREKITDDEDPRLKTIDEEIKKLNQDIASFNNRPASGTRSLYATMEKYALTDSAKTIDSVRLKSFLYGQVYAGPKDAKRGKFQLSVEEANKKHVAGAESFDRALGDWTDQYLVAKGDLYPIQKTERERAVVIDKMNKRYYDYQKTEMENYNKYCATGWTGSVKNPVQCQTFMSGVEQRRNTELKRREKDLNYIKGRNAKLSKMGTSYNEYQKRQVAEETKDQFETYGSSYSSYEDNFTDLHPEYNGPQMSSAFNPQMYQMGGQQAAMNMGQFGMYNPQMVNPQMPIQQGQFQMPVLPRMN